MEGKICPYCDTWKVEDEYYGQYYKGVFKRDYSSCKVCRKIRAMELKAKRDSKYKQCKKCDRPFGDRLKHFSKGYCTTCHKIVTSPKEGNCKDCGVYFNSGNVKQTRHMSKGRCKRCYEKWRKANLKTTCNYCGEKMDKPTLKPKCSLCREKEKIESETKMIQKGIKRNRYAELSPEDFETLRRLLVKFKWGQYALVDTFIVANLFDKLFGHVQSLDAKDPEIQVVLMLKKLKSVYDSNKERF